MGYLAEHMDAANNFAPLFEAHLELQEPDIIFVPPLDSTSPDNFSSFVKSLTEDIIKMANLIPRVASHYLSPDYQVMLPSNHLKIQLHLKTILCTSLFTRLLSSDTR